MGHNHSTNKLTNNNSSSSHLKNDEDYPQLGSVQVQLSWLASTNRSSQQTEIIITGRGALFHGNQ